MADTPLLEEATSTTGEKVTSNQIVKYAPGDKDTHGNIVKHVYASTAKYIVYEVEAPIELSCVCFLADTPERQKLANNLNIFKSKTNELKAILYKCNNDEAIKNRRGLIISLGLTNPEEAIIQLDNLIDDINNTYKEGFEKKIFYLAGAFAILLLFCTIASIIRIGAIEKYIDPKFETLELIFYILTSGVIGGFISVSYKLKYVVFEKGISRWYFLAYGIERLVLSILASIVLFFAVKANIIFGFIKDAPNPFYGYIILGILAGFSETLIPSLLIKIEKQGLESKEEK